MPTQRLYAVPDFLDGQLTQEVYQRWLSRKTAAHLRRDKKGGNEVAKGAAYRKAIHEAVCKCNGHDCYTGEKLDWSLLSKYDNESSKQGKRAYKHKFHLLPTVDHVEGRMGDPVFVICAWRTNDAKGDLSPSEFIDLCKRVLVHHKHEVRCPTSAMET